MVGMAASLPLINEASDKIQGAGSYADAAGEAVSQGL